MAPVVRRSLGALVNIAIVFVVQVVNLKRSCVVVVPQEDVPDPHLQGGERGGGIEWL